jgi:hypothetical protein
MIRQARVIAHNGIFCVKQLSLSLNNTTAPTIFHANTNSENTTTKMKNPKPVDPNAIIRASSSIVNRKPQTMNMIINTTTENVNVTAALTYSHVESVIRGSLHVVTLQVKFPPGSMVPSMSQLTFMVAFAQQVAPMFLPAMMKEAIGKARVGRKLIRIIGSKNEHTMSPTFGILC